MSGRFWWMLRNVGVKNSSAELIAFLDSDDIWDKEKLSKQIKFMI